MFPFLLTQPSLKSCQEKHNCLFTAFSILDLSCSNQVNHPEFQHSSLKVSTNQSNVSSNIRIFPCWIKFGLVYSIFIVCKILLTLKISNIKKLCWMKSIPEQISIKHFTAQKLNIFIQNGLVECASSICYIQYLEHLNVHSIFICINKTPLHYMILQTVRKLTSYEQITTSQTTKEQKAKEEKSKDRQCNLSKISKSKRF